MPAETCPTCGEPTDPWLDGDGGDERCRCGPATPPTPDDDAKIDAKIDAILADRSDADLIRECAKRDRDEHGRNCPTPAPLEEKCWKCGGGVERTNTTLPGCDNDIFHDGQPPALPTEGAHPNGPVEGCPCHLCRFAFADDAPEPTVTLTRAEYDAMRAVVEQPTRGDVGRPESTRDPVFLLRWRPKKVGPHRDRWHVEGVWFTRQEAERFAEAHAYRWGSDRYGPCWHVYCVPAEGDLARLLKTVTKRDAALRGATDDKGGE